MASASAPLLTIAVVVQVVLIGGACGQGIQDVGLELRVRVQEGDPSIQSIQNHGWIDIETIGEQRNFGDTFLVCATSTPDNGTIDWYFPNGTGVSDDGEITGPDIYMNRTATLAHLSRRRNATTPVGIYRCEISGSNGGTTFLYAGIYTSTGGIINDIVMTYNSSTLTLACTSTGGPATNVTWMKDGELLVTDGTTYQQRQMVVDMQQAVYDNMLTFQSEAVDGNYSCQVSNLRSSQSKDIIIGGALISTTSTMLPPAQISFDLSPTNNQSPTFDQSLSSTKFLNPPPTLTQSLPFDTSTSGFVLTELPPYESQAFPTTTHVQEMLTTSLLHAPIMTAVTTESSLVVFVFPTTTRVSESSLVIFPSSSTSLSPLAASVSASPTSSVVIAPSSVEFSTTILLPEASSTPSESIIDTTEPSSRKNGASVAGGVVGAILVAFLVSTAVFFIVVAVLRFRKRKREMYILQTGINDGRTMSFIYPASPPFETISFQEYFDNAPLSDADTELTNGVEDIETVEEHAVVNGTYTAMSNNKDRPPFEKPILKAQFSDHVKMMHKNRDDFFEVEYASLDKSLMADQVAAKLPCNKPKNRFANNHPYDFSRVVLNEIEGMEGSDYINASFVDGYDKPKAYIAAQGPMPNTVNDFWRMIWEKRISTIVMLTKCIEAAKRKCERYWPKSLNESMDIGQDLSVSLTSFVQLTEYTIRKMTISHLELTQFHYTSWPDHGVPADCIAMTKFVKHVRKVHPYSDPCPLLVHCSAGVGRTGTFIVLDSMLERMKTEDTLNIYEFLKQLRNQRVLMVQTLKQYIFAHDVIAELITCGDTEISAIDLRLAINKLSEVDNDGKTGFSIQFKTLEKVSSSVSSTVAKCTSDESSNNERISSEVWPNEGTQSQLKNKTREWTEGNYIDGYKQTQVYLATQQPLESSVGDFWRGMWDKRSRCIVQLCSNNQDSNDQYWPTEEGSSDTYGKLRVSLLSEEISTAYTTRTLELVECQLHGQTKKAKVVQFHVQNWPPSTSSVILDLIERVNRVQMGQGRVPITVMCNNGVGRTGTFICIHAQLERLKTEGVVDFFQFIKGARIQRPGFILNLADYILCHTVTADYLDTFDDYANFKEI